MSKKLLTELTVIGDELEKERFRVAVNCEDEDGLNLNSLISLPSDEELEKIYGWDDIRSWTLANWGTPCNVSSEDVGWDEDGNLVFRFFSSIFPPIEWLQTASRQFPGLEFELWHRDEYLDEDGVIVLIQNGEIKEERVDKKLTLKK